MSSSQCRLIAARLQQALHSLHEGIGDGLAEVASSASRYIQALRRHRPDPEMEALLQYTAARLRAIHSAAERYLPAPNTYRVSHRPKATGKVQTADHKKETTDERA